MSDKLKGWIKFHRKILADPIFDNEKLLKVWIWCLLKASHQKHDQMVGRQIVQLNIGQFVTGRYAAGDELKLAPTTAWDYIKILEKNNNIHIKSGNKFSVVTVINWGLYQFQDENYDSKCDNKTTAIQQQTDTNNNVKKAKNVKNNIYYMLEDYTENTMLREALNNFYEMRQAMNAHLTVKSTSLLLKSLDSLADTDVAKIKIIEQSVLNNWKTFYPLKSVYNNNKHKSVAKNNKFNNFIQHEHTPGAYEEFAEKKREEKYKEIDNRSSTKNNYV